MTWQDLSLVAQAAQRLGYQPIQPMALADPEEGQAVPTEMAFQKPGGAALGLRRTEEGGVEVVADDAEALKDFVQPVSQLYAFNKAVAALRQMGYGVEHRQLPNGEIQLTAVRWENSRHQAVQGTVNSNGEATLEVQGVPGPRCGDLVGRVVQAMDAQVLAQERTAEYYEPEPVEIHREAHHV
jgi:hypothetical protein